LLLGCSALLASEIVTKWKSNLRALQKRKASEILALVEKGDSESLKKAASELQVIAQNRWER
jgi:hypothetical protein